MLWHVGLDDGNIFWLQQQITFKLLTCKVARWRAAILKSSQNASRRRVLDPDWLTRRVRRSQRMTGIAPYSRSVARRAAAVTATTATTARSARPLPPQRHFSRTMHSTENARAHGVHQLEVAHPWFKLLACLIG